MNDPQPALWVGRATTKTDAGARRVPLNAMAQWAINKLRERAEALGSCKPEHYLLPENMSRHRNPHQQRVLASVPFRRDLGH